MSDEMVQEKTETAGDAAPDGANAVGEPGGAPLAPVSSSVAAPAATDEPAPAQPVALTAASDPPVPSAPAAGSDAGEFERAMQDYDKQFDQSLNQLLQDTVVNGTVMRIDREGVLVDVELSPKA